MVDDEADPGKIALRRRLKFSGSASGLNSGKSRLRACGAMLGSSSDCRRRADVRRTFPVYPIQIPMGQRSLQSAAWFSALVSTRFGRSSPQLQTQMEAIVADAEHQDARIKPDHFVRLGADEFSRSGTSDIASFARRTFRSSWDSRPPNRSRAFAISDFVKRGSCCDTA
ncbi:hypothetical protein SV7mr_18880 [Stieleria bergensis]|uniref:Uncharacterized protein n=1 Tax=Stieleria bergensis TaxID=2528025 RepID=A0A517STC8_9BACT|nr:hypothetical protein SV7mr_18880 [Planctomycetes bacterium SV_7m_r]